MQRLASFNIGANFDRPAPRIAAQIAFGLICPATMIGLRMFVDIWVPTAGPFALVYPTVLIATLYGNWRAGVITWITTILWVWYTLLSVTSSFAFNEAAEPMRLLFNALAALIVLVLAESFRGAVATAVAERDAEISRRTMLMSEIEHRTKNNFALVVSLLEFQKRKESDPRVERALDMAASRIHSFARAYANLAESQGEGESVAMKPYMREVVTHFADGAFHDGIIVSLKTAACLLPREVAVAIGLFTNEALTNCAKYAFPNDRAGRVDIRFSADARHWELLIKDDGAGIEAKAEGITGDSGLGNALLKAFAKQADAKYQVEDSGSGLAVRLTST